jgi:hypothetical protein
MLSFQMINEGRGIQMNCDEEGMVTLIEALKKIKTAGHVHLLTPSNGGRELSEQTPWGKETIGEVIITWTGE